MNYKSQIDMYGEAPHRGRLTESELVAIRSLERGDRQEELYFSLTGYTSLLQPQRRRED